MNRTSTSSVTPHRAYGSIPQPKSFEVYFSTRHASEEGGIPFIRYFLLLYTYIRYMWLLQVTEGRILFSFFRCRQGNWLQKRSSRSFESVKHKLEVFDLLWSRSGRIANLKEGFDETGSIRISFQSVCETRGRTASGVGFHEMEDDGAISSVGGVTAAVSSTLKVVSGELLELVAVWLYSFSSFKDCLTWLKGSECIDAEKLEYSQCATSDSLRTVDQGYFHHERD